MGVLQTICLQIRGTFMSPTLLLLGQNNCWIAENFIATVTDSVQLEKIINWCNTWKLESGTCQEWNAGLSEAPSTQLEWRASQLMIQQPDHLCPSVKWLWSLARNGGPAVQNHDGGQCSLWYNSQTISKLQCTSVRVNDDWPGKSIVWQSLWFKFWMKSISPLGEHYRSSSWLGTAAAAIAASPLSRSCSSL